MTGILLLPFLIQSPHIKLECRFFPGDHWTFLSPVVTKAWEVDGAVVQFQRFYAPKQPGWVVPVRLYEDDFLRLRAASELRK